MIKIWVLIGFFTDHSAYSCELRSCCCGLYSYSYSYSCGGFGVDFGDGDGHFCRFFCGGYFLLARTSVVIIPYSTLSGYCARIFPSIRSTRSIRYGTG